MEDYPIVREKLKELKDVMNEPERTFRNEIS